MGNQREIRQVTPREGPGVVLRIRPDCSVVVERILGDPSTWNRFYMYLVPAGKPIEFPNLDGPEVKLGPQQFDRLVIQSGGKMWCGYPAFTERVRELAPFVEDALFYVGDEEDYIDEFQLLEGTLRYRRVHSGCYCSVEGYLQLPENPTGESGL